jgi:hypothetical protein
VYHLGRLQGLARRLRAHRLLDPRAGRSYKSVLQALASFASACGYDGGLSFRPGQAGECVIHPHGDTAPWLVSLISIFLCAKEGRCEIPGRGSSLVLRGQRAPCSPIRTCPWMVFKTRTVTGATRLRPGDAAKANRSAFCRAKATART